MDVPNRRITLGSLFDGAGGFPLAGTYAGIEPLWAAEIEPFPIRVTTRRFPDMQHMGSITEIDGGAIPPVDIITFGSPCQDLSVAGKRAGLGGERSGLFHEAVRVIKEMREATHGMYPTFVVWENVVGALSSGGGDDFREVLQSLARIKDDSVSIPRPARWTGAGEILGDGWSIGWRVLDAQYWGVPQRRRRIYLVADFGGQRARYIQFERESLCGSVAKGAGEGKGVAADIEGGAGGNSWGGGRNLTPIAIENNAQDSRMKQSGDIVQTLSAKMGTGGNNTPVVMCAAYMGGAGRKAGSIGYSETVAPTLRAEAGGNSVSHVLQAYNNRVVGTICANQSKFPTNQGVESGQAIVQEGRSGYILRRLTPTECGRLQGFPDGWCGGLETPKPTEEELNWWGSVFAEHSKATGAETKPKTPEQVRRWLQNPYSDSAAYKMWGNSLAIPCAYTVLAGVAQAIENGINREEEQ